MDLYVTYLDQKYHWITKGISPWMTEWSKEESLIFANLVLQRNLYGRERFYRELSKRTGKQFEVGE